METLEVTHCFSCSLTIGKLVKNQVRGELIKLVDVGGGLRRLAASAVFALCVFFAIVAAGGECAGAEVNEALESAGTKVFSSSAPNPAWPASQVNDGLTDTTRGWLGSDDEGAAWVAFEFDSPRKVSGIVFYQAGLTEGGAGRFSRPRRVRITLGGAEPRIVELADSERKPQKVDITPTETKTVKIDILSNYSDAKFPFLTGFQEVEIYTTDVVNFVGGDGGNPASAGATIPGSASSSGSAADALPSPKTAGTGSEKVAPVDGGAGKDAAVEATAEALESAISGAVEKDGLDGDEVELLRLLHEFTAKLEEYFRKKNTETN